MFTRPDGWIPLISSHSGEVFHYFRENQGKSICGTSEVVNMGVHSSPKEGQPVCGRCIKYIKINKIPKTGRKHRDSKWGGLKY